VRPRSRSDASRGSSRARVGGGQMGRGSVVKCRRMAERYGERLDQAMHPSHGRGVLSGQAPEWPG
jgi:hypothetical protein